LHRENQLAGTSCAKPLSNDELVSNDQESWATRGGRGVQVLFWNYTPPQTKESDQVYFKRDLPARSLGQARVSVNGLRPGSYTLNVYQIGYGVNDVYTDYLRLGSPPSLTREQVRSLAEQNSGRPISTERVVVKSSGAFARDLPLHENDVYLLTLQ